MLFLHFEKDLSQLPFFGKQGPKFSMSIWEENKEDCHLILISGHIEFLLILVFLVVLSFVHLFIY